MKYIVIALVILGMIGFFFIFNPFTATSKATSTRQTTVLEKVGDKCVGISESATATIVPIIEFQKLELISRKANVVLRCMNDHGFIENPAWIQYAQPIAQQNANQSKISYDEALENLKRSNMLIFSSNKGQPMFWIKSK